MGAANCTDRPQSDTQNLSDGLDYIYNLWETRKWSELDRALQRLFVDWENVTIETQLLSQATFSRLCTLLIGILEQPKGCPKNAVRLALAMLSEDSASSKLLRFGTIPTLLELFLSTAPLDASFQGITSSLTSLASQNQSTRDFILCEKVVKQLSAQMRDFQRISPNVRSLLTRFAISLCRAQPASNDGLVLPLVHAALFCLARGVDVENASVLESAVWCIGYYCECEPERVEDLQEETDFIQLICAITKDILRRPRCLVLLGPFLSAIQRLVQKSDKTKECLRTIDHGKAYIELIALLSVQSNWTRVPPLDWIFTIASDSSTYKDMIMRDERVQSCMTDALASPDSPQWLAYEIFRFLRKFVSPTESLGHRLKQAPVYQMLLIAITHKHAGISIFAGADVSTIDDIIPLQQRVRLCSSYRNTSVNERLLGVHSSIALYDAGNQVQDLQWCLFAGGLPDSNLNIGSGTAGNNDVEHQANRNCERYRVVKSMGILLSVNTVERIRRIAQRPVWLGSDLWRLVGQYIAVE